jgi:hypothetical protein
VRRDASVAAVRDPDDHRDQLFDSPVQGARRQRCSAHLAESAIDLRDHLPQGAVLWIQVVQDIVVMVRLIHGSQLYPWGYILERRIGSASAGEGEDFVETVDETVVEDVVVGNRTGIDIDAEGARVKRRTTM